MSILKLLPRFRTLERDLAVRADRETWSRNDIESFQIERLNEIWRSARRTVPYYRVLAAEHNLPESFASLAEYSQSMPRLSKPTLRQRGRELLCETRPKGRWKMTGGSTGDPTRVFWGRPGHHETLRGKYRFLQEWGVEPLDPMVFLWGHSASFEPGWRGWVGGAEQWIADRLRSRLRLSAYRTGAADLQNYVRQIQRFAPNSLYGYSAAVALLAQQAKDMDAKFPNMKAVIMTAEPVLPAQRRLVQDAFHAPAVAEYGSVECGFLAGEASDGMLQVREDSVFLEAKANEHGTYDVLVTVLCNPAFPLLRYEIGDLTEAPLMRPAQGFARLTNVLGRSNDYVVTPRGKFLHPIAFMDCLEILVPQLGRFHLHQAADSTLTLEIEKAVEGRDPRWENQVKNRLATLTEGLSVEIRTVDSVKQTVAGKRRFITSDMAAC